MPEASRPARLTELATLFLRLGVDRVRGAGSARGDDGRRSRPPPGLADSRAFLDLPGRDEPHSRTQLDRARHPHRARRAGLAGLLDRRRLLHPARGHHLGNRCGGLRPVVDAPVAGALLYGVKPAVIAIVVQALIGLGHSSIRSRWLAIVAIVAAVLPRRASTSWQCSDWLPSRRSLAHPPFYPGRPRGSSVVLCLSASAGAASALAAAPLAPVPFTLTQLFLAFCAHRIRSVRERVRPAGVRSCRVSSSGSAG